MKLFPFATESSSGFRQPVRACLQMALFLCFATHAITASSQLTFGALEYLTPEPHSYLCATAHDVNDDGLTDVLCGTTSSVLWFPQLGEHHFSGGRMMVDGFSDVEDILVADFDQDGLNDYLVVSSNAEVLDWIEWDGENATVQSQLTGFDGALDRIQVVDVNGDGWLDVVAIEPSCDCIKCAYNEAGTLSSAVVLVEGIGGWIDVDIAPMEPGALPTILAASSVGHRVYRCLQSEPGVFSAPLIYFQGGPAFLFSHARAFDHDGDGTAHLLVSRNSSGLTHVIDVTGSGTWEEIDSFWLPSSFVSEITISDLDGDGGQDAVLFEPGSGKVGWSYLSTFSGSLADYTAMPDENGFLVDDDVLDCCLVDVGSDGNYELILVGASQLHYVQAASWSHMINPFWSVGSPCATSRFVVADVTGDGLADLVQGKCNGQDVICYPALGNGAYATYPETMHFENDRLGPWCMGDMDGDGDADLALEVNSSNGSFGPYEDESWEWVERLGEDHYVRHEVSATENDLKALTMLDYNTDGAMDILGAYYNGNMAGFRQLAGGFEGPDQQGYSQPIDILRTGDFDGNGTQDVLVAYQVGCGYSPIPYTRISWFSYGDTNGFEEEVVLVVGVSQLEEIRLGDLEGDGDLDVLVHLCGGATYWYINDGTGVFPTTQAVTTLSCDRGLAVADLNGNGRLEVIGANAFNIHVHGADGSLSYGDAPIFQWTSPTNLGQVEVEDFNQDGLPDILTATEQRIVALPNTSLMGCIDPEACNFDPTAGYSDQSCVEDCALAGDVDGNGVVEMTDVLILLSVYGCAESCTFDVTGDDQITVADLLLVLSQY